MNCRGQRKSLGRWGQEARQAQDQRPRHRSLQWERRHKAGVSSSAAGLFPDIPSERAGRMNLCHPSILKEEAFNLKLHKELQE